MLPSSFFRTYFENSITLSSQVSKDTHIKHCERKTLKIIEGNAFQAVGKVELEQDMTKERIERPLVGNKKKNPSSWVLVFNKLGKFLKNVEFRNY